jgi:hypothetical protein
MPDRPGTADGRNERLAEALRADRQLHQFLSPQDLLV